MGVDAGRKVGALKYIDEHGGWASLAQDDPEPRSSFYCLVGNETEFPPGADISLDLVRQAIKEFLATGGERPGCVAWKEDTTLQSRQFSVSRAGDQNVAGSLEWLRQWFDEVHAARLNEVAVSMSASRSIGVADLARAWWEHISKLEADLSATPEDQSVWGAHDFVAALVVRDALAKGITRLEGELRQAVEPAVASVDQRFRAFTEPDEDGCIKRVDGRSSEGRGWWWARVPRQGPIHAEMQLYYGHTHHDVVT